MKKSFVELLNEGIIEQVEKREAAVVQGGGVEPKEVTGKIAILH